MQDPMGISGLVYPCSTDAKKATALSKLSTAATRARKAVEYRLTNTEQAFQYWDLVFNNEFPSRYASL